MRLLWIENDPGLPRGAADPLAGLDERVARELLGVLAEGKAIGSSGSHRDGEILARDARLRLTGPGQQPLTQHLRAASRNVSRDLAPVESEARRSIGMLLRSWRAPGSPMTRARVEQETAKRWTEAYERVREIGRRASAVDRMHPASQLLPAEETWFRGAVREELRFWHLFLDEVAAGNVDEDRMWERFDAYLRALRFMYESARVLALPDSVLLYWMGPKKDEPGTCEGCAYMMERSPFPKHKIPAVPVDGSTPCLTNCRHWIVARVASLEETSRRTQALPSRESMVTALRRIKDEAHGPQRRERAHAHARRTRGAGRPHVHNPFIGRPLPSGGPVPPSMLRPPGPFTIHESAGTRVLKMATKNGKTLPLLIRADRLAAQDETRLRLELQAEYGQRLDGLTAVEDGDGFTVYRADWAAWEELGEGAFTYEEAAAEPHAAVVKGKPALLAPPHDFRHEPAAGDVETDPSGYHGQHVPAGGSIKLP